jgi:hypothetical protein
MEKNPNYNKKISTGCHHLNYAILNKRKGQSRMNNPERLATLGTQDEGKTKKTKTKNKKHTTQYALDTTIYTNKHK